MIPTFADPMVFGIIIGIVIILLVILILFSKRTRREHSPGGGNSGQRSPRLAYQPDARPVPSVVVKAIPHPVRKNPVPPKPKEISLLNGRTDITQSLVALVEKYSLDQVTIATSDGLVFASNGAESDQDDAAQFSGKYTENSSSEIPGIILVGISHKDSDLLLIVRTPLPVSEEIRQAIENDTKDILNWWI
jgi:hypothetical protein